MICGVGYSQWHTMVAYECASSSRNRMIGSTAFAKERAGENPVMNGATDYLTIEEAATMSRWAAKTIRNKMADGTLREGVHFVRPRRGRPRIIRVAFEAHVRGADDSLMVGG